jgi:uncharacterized protein
MYKIILKAVSGSISHGLDTKDSDTDYSGIFLYPTKTMLRINKPKRMTFDTRHPGILKDEVIGSDFSFHEIEKFMSMASKCNPSILEILFSGVYERVTWEGKLLVDNKNIFLNKIAYFSYFQYAEGQAKKLAKYGYFPEVGRSDRRQEKHCRHMFRLLQQGDELLSTGNITVKVSNPKEIMELGKLPVTEAIQEFYKRVNELEAKYLVSKNPHVFNEKVVLPDVPDIELINKILYKIRMSNLVLESVK